MATALISAVHGRKAWNGVRRLVKQGKKCPHDKLEFYADMSLFSESIPLKLAVTVKGNIVGHSEIRDLGTARYGICIAGLSNTIVTPGYRHRGIYTELIVLRNIILDLSGFLFVAGRVKRGYEERYMNQYPGFVRVKDEDADGAAWVLRSVGGRPYTDEMLSAAMEHLENIEKW